MSRFVPNRDFADDLRNEPEYRQALNDSAEVVSDHASSFARHAQAPWMKRQSDTIVVSTEGDDVAVVNTDYAAHLMEWGGRNNPAHAPLRRAVRAAGLHFKEAPKGVG